MYFCPQFIIKLEEEGQDDEVEVAEGGQEEQTDESNNDGERVWCEVGLVLKLHID